MLFYNCDEYLAKISSINIMGYQDNNAYADNAYDTPQQDAANSLLFNKRRSDYEQL